MCFYEEMTNEFTKVTFAFHCFINIFLLKFYSCIVIKLLLQNFQSVVENVLPKN